MDGDSPEPQPFDPEQPEARALADGVVGGFVLLVAASDAADPEWAERSAAALATRWARQGRRILLADLSLTSPGLHRILGVENGEGVSDTFLYGSSIQRVARPVRDHGFLFVSAGTATARPEGVTGSPRWASIVDGCARVHATLVVYLPSDLPGGEMLLERASDVILLTDASAAGSATLQAALGDRLRAVLVPPIDGGAKPAAASVEDGAARTADSFAFESPIASVDSLEFASPIVTADAAADEPPSTFDMPSFAPFGAEEPAMGTSLDDAEAAPSIAPSDAAASGSPEPASDFSIGMDDDLDLGPPAPAIGGAAETEDAPDVPSISDVLSGSDVLGGVAMDFGLGSLDHLPQEEQPQFTGELSFMEPEAEPARAPELVVESGPLPEWAQAPDGSRSTSEVRGNDIPMRDDSADEARERARPASRPATPRPTAKEEAPPRKSRVGVLVGLLLLAAVGAVGAAWLGLVDIPWLSAMLPARTAAAAGSGGAAAAPTPDPVAAPINEFAYALTLDQFTDPAPPRLQAASLNEQRPDLLFVVSPVAVGGKVYYRLLAGPAVDSAGAEALRETLKTVLTRENSARWTFHATPFAFNLGDRDDLASAAERVAELSRVDIPSYVLELPGRTGGRPRYRVYGGAFADEQEAEYLRKFLLEKGFPDARLVQRIGRHPQ